VSGGPGRDTVSYAERSEGLQPIGVPQSVAVRLDAVANDGGQPDGGADNVQPDVEVLVGTAEDDLLQGAGAAELLVGGRGRDTLSGLLGDDLLDGGDGPDLMDGGGGLDTATYDTSRPVDGLTPPPRTEGVVVTLDGVADDGSAADGAPGDRDDVRTENVVGTSLNDVLRGDAGANALDGLTGEDVLESFGGDDSLDGGKGKDRLSAGGGDDSVFTNDGAPDELSCGEGFDGATVDLQDRSIPVAKGVLPLAAECEKVVAAPVGQLPNVAIGERVRRDGDRVTLRLACPRTAARACRGSLVLLDARERTVSARPGRFALRRGARVAIRLQVRHGARGLIAVATERAPDGRRKTTRLPLR
jgi:hypothetical protein